MITAEILRCPFGYSFDFAQGFGLFRAKGLFAMPEEIASYRYAMFVMTSRNRFDFRFEISDLIFKISS